MARLFLLLFAISITQISAQERATVVHTAQPPIEVDEHQPIEFKLETGLKEGWEATDKVVELESDFQIPELVQLRSIGSQTFAWAPPGQYLLTGKQIYINWTKQDVFKRTFEVKITVRGKVNPDPKPVPKPDPNPTPDGTNPFAGTIGLKVLIIEEQDERNRPEKRAQYAIFSTAEIRNYLDAKTAKAVDGTPEWRILDKDTVFNTPPNGAQSQWKKAMAVRGPTTPWIIISDGRRWASTAIPNTAADLLILLRQYTPPSSNTRSVITPLQRISGIPRSIDYLLAG